MKNSIGLKNCKPPLVFTIPFNVYGDEMQKERDKEAFLKIKQLQKKCGQLCKKLHANSEQHFARIEAMKSAVERSLPFSDVPKQEENRDN